VQAHYGIYRTPTLGVLLKTSRRWEAATGDVIAARQPLDSAALARLEQAAATGAARSAAVLARTHTTRTAALVGALLLGVSGGWLIRRSELISAEHRLAAAFDNEPSGATA